MYVYFLIPYVDYHSHQRCGHSRTRSETEFCILSDKKNCNRTRFMIKQLNLNRFQQNLQKITLNNLAINVQNFENWQSY